MNDRATLLDRKCARGKQSLELVSLWRVFTGTATEPPHKLRVRRVRDAFDFQSSARVERWDGERWQELVTLPFATMDADSYYGPESKTVRPTPAELADEAELLRLALLVL